MFKIVAFVVLLGLIARELIMIEKKRAKKRSFYFEGDQMYLKKKPLV
jgi:hypothetical protein